MKVSWLPFFLLLLFSSSSAFFCSVRCNKKQTSCQLRTKRLTIGDYVISVRISFYKPLEK